MTESPPPNADLAADLSGWAAAARAGAEAAVARLAPPTGREEEWRFTDPTRFPFAAPPPCADVQGVVAQVRGDAVTLATEVADRYGSRAALVVTGAAGTVVCEPAGADSGVRIAALGAEADPAIAAVAGSLLDAETDLAVASAVAGVRDGVVVHAGPGARLDAPVVIVHVAVADATTAARSLVVVESTAELDVIEVWAGGGRDAFVPAVCELVVRDGARLRHCAVQDVTDATAHLATIGAKVGRDATLVASAALLGASTTRLVVDVDLAGEGADVELVGAYLGDDARHVDLRTRQHHTASRTTSRLRYHGAVAGASSSIFSGVIRIEPDAAQTNAQQASHYLVLSDDAHAASIPNLEILNHDTACGHAASGGPPDPEQLYYLAARGIDPAVARRLIVDGFFADIVAQLPLPAVRAFTATAITQRLARERAAAAV